MAAQIDKQKTSKNANSQMRINRYIRHAQDDFHLTVLGPNINRSNEKVEATDKNTISQSLLTKDVDQASIAQVLSAREEREIESMDDFYRRLGKDVNKKAISSWICSGAFDDFGIVRSAALCAVPKMKDAISSVLAAQKRAAQSGRVSKITYDTKVKIDEFTPDIQEFPDETKYCLEKNYTGVYISGHPLDRYQGVMRNIQSIPLSSFEYEISEETGEVRMLNQNVRNGMSVTVVAILGSIMKTTTKDKGLPMSILTLEDKTMEIKGLLFPEAYEQYKDALNLTSAFKITGSAKISPDEPPVLIVKTLEPLDLAVMPRIIFDCKTEKEVKAVFAKIKGAKGAGDAVTPVYIDTNNLRILLKSEYWVDKDLFLGRNKFQNVRVEEW